MQSLKVGVIGCGSIAQHRHLLEYQANEHVKVVAVCDIQQERATSTGQQYEAKFFTDYNELLKEELDAVSVCLPNYLHAPVSIAALRAGKHVLCEKPMAISDEEAEQMIQAAKENQKTLMIGHNQRFVASHQKAHQLIKNGEIGKILSFRTTFGHGGPEGWSADGKTSWFFQKDQAFIGAMGDLGVHKADLMRYLLDDEMVQVSAFIDTIAKTNTDVDDNAVVLLRSAKGALGTLTASWSYNAKEDNSTIIYGEKGTIRLENDPQYGLIIEYASGEIVRYELGKIQSNESGGQTSSHVIDHFVDAVLNQTPPLIDGEEGKKSLAIILAAVKSSETGKIVSINE